MNKTFNPNCKARPSNVRGKRYRTLFFRSIPSGFTLVELLVVITIIGAIAALTIPAVSAVMKIARSKAMRAEMSSMESGIDSYYTKYSDYPPDFSSWNIVKRHYNKIFPDIAQSELNLLLRLCDTYLDDDPMQMAAAADPNLFDPTAVDRSEAIVWSLGGFSADTQFPFTGSGGPLVRLPSAAALAADDPQAYEYNPIRNGFEVDFAPERLSVRTFDPNAPKSYTNRTMSNDEGTTGRADVFPNYILRDGASPVVYFDSRTYAAFVPAAVPQFNGYARIVDGEWDAIRPVYSTTANNPPAVPPYGSLDAAAAGWEFMSPRTYQLHAPGLDGLYGDIADADGGDPTNANPAYFRVDGAAILLNGAANDPTGLIVPAIQRFDVTGLLSTSQNPFRDNMASFLQEGTFFDSLK